MDEFALIEKYFVRRGEGSGVVAGIGDDGAVLQPDAGRELVNVIDTLVAGIHFPEGTDAFDIGFRAVAVNLSDIAAMGARPRWMTLALTLPHVSETWMQGFADGLFAAADDYRLALVGGDTTLGKALVISVQITGDVASGMALRRSGAQAGDAIYVTGTVGDAAGGLELLLAGKPDNYLSRRFLRPNARVACGQALAGIATAAIDVSDGLYGDLGKLLTASGVGATLQLENLPLSNELKACFGADERHRLALTGGDDYELCFTARAGTAPELRGCPVTRIGTVTDSDTLQLTLEGRPVPFTDQGYRHFR